jgi:hypothetical protein
MEPIIKDLNTKKTLVHTASLNGRDFTEVNIKKLILRPVLKRIVFITEEFDRIIVYQGDTDYAAHHGDSDETLTNALLAKIDADHKK